MSFLNKISLVFGCLLSHNLFAANWQSLGEMPNGEGAYSAALIESTGFLSESVTIWLKASYTLNERGCGDENNVYCNAAKNKDQEKPRETIYKLVIDCDRKVITRISSHSVDFAGRQVSDNNLNLEPYPGSIGELLTNSYCQ